MRKTSPTVKKFGYYMEEDLGNALLAFCDNQPSQDMPGMIVMWMALASSARDRLRAAGKNQNIKEAVSQARKILKEELVDTILLEYARNLPREAQVKIIKKATGR